MQGKNVKANLTPVSLAKLNTTDIDALLNTMSDRFSRKINLDELTGLGIEPLTIYNLSFLVDCTTLEEFLKSTDLPLYRGKEPIARAIPCIGVPGGTYGNRLYAPVYARDMDPKPMSSLGTDSEEHTVAVLERCITNSQGERTLNYVAYVIVAPICDYRSSNIS